MKITIDIEAASGMVSHAEIKRFDPPGGDVLGAGIERQMDIKITHQGQDDFLRITHAVACVLRAVPNEKE